MSVISYSLHANYTDDHSKVIIASLSIFFFVCLSYAASFIATFLVSAFDLDEPPRTSFIYLGGFGWDWVNPVEVFYNLMRLVARVLRDEELLVDGTVDRSGIRSPSGLLGNFIRRVVIGVPVIGVASLIQLLASFHFLAPLNILARTRGRNRRESSRDVAMIIILGAIILGTLRFVAYKNICSRMQLLNVTSSAGRCEVSTALRKDWLNTCSSGQRMRSLKLRRAPCFLTR